MSDLKTLWETVLAEIAANISSANFSTWFKNTSLVKQENETVYLGVPNSFVREWLANKYHKPILRAIRNTIPEIKNLDYLITKNPAQGEPKTVNVSVVGPKNFPTHQPVLEELYINKEDNLNPRYVFDSFVVGPFNELAYAAAEVVTKSVASAYNPLFVYGGTGLGKTHLIQAVGNAIKKNHPTKKVFYVTSERFVVDFVSAMQNNRGHYFKDHYRQYDVVVMDDIQFLSGKDRSQEELFHLFNSLYENNKQIVFSSDKPPKYIPQIEDRLRSRFEGGMIVDISKPDFESRLAILKRKCQTSPLYPGDEVLEYIASVIQDNIRELEGTLNLVICQSQLKNQVLSLEEVKNLIKNNIKPPKTISVKTITSVVADFYNLDEEFLYQKNRRKEVVKPRQIVMYLLREDFNASYPHIGQKLGGRDHTTVIHACDKIKNDLKKDSFLGRELEQIRNILYQKKG